MGSVTYVLYIGGVKCFIVLSFCEMFYDYGGVYFCGMYVLFCNGCVHI